MPDDYELQIRETELKLADMLDELRGNKYDEKACREFARLLRTGLYAEGYRKSKSPHTNLLHTIEKRAELETQYIEMLKKMRSALIQKMFL